MAAQYYPEQKNKVTIQQQIDFIRGARHLVHNPKKTIEIGKGAYDVLLAIEKTLCAAQIKGI
jgi:hypothetical protein